MNILTKWDEIQFSYLTTRVLPFSISNEVLNIKNIEFFFVEINAFFLTESINVKRSYIYKC